MILNTKKTNVVHFVEWFPNEEDQQLGVFIQKHIEAIGRFTKSTVIYIKPFSKEQKDEITIQEVNGIKIIRGFYRNATSKNKAGNFFNYWKITKKCFSLLEKIDVIHLHVLGKNALFVLNLKRKTKLPIFVTEHWSGWLDDYYAKSLWRGKWVRHAIMQSQGVSVVSEVLKEKIESFTNRKNIALIPNIVSNVGLRKEKESSEMRFLTVADLEDEIKNISGIIRAFSELKSQGFDRWKLDIIGDGSDKSHLISLSKSLGLEEIRFLGRKTNDEVLTAFPNYDCFISNSRKETFGLALAEAIASGVPVISANSGGPSSFITEENGLLIPVDNNSELQSAIKKMTVNLGNYPPKKVQASLANFSAEEIGKQFLDWYERGSNQIK